MLIYEESDDCGEDESGEDCECDLDCAVRALALDFAGAGVDQEAEDFVAVAVGADPDGEENMFKCNIFIYYIQKLLNLARQQYDTTLADLPVRGIIHNHGTSVSWSWLAGIARLVSSGCVSERCAVGSGTAWRHHLEHMAQGAVLVSY